MPEFTGTDLAVVIPTRDRWDILDKTLSSLSSQSVSGFETIVVVDGTDQDLPPLDASRVVVKRRAGPGAARNFGAEATERPLVMFLGDDTIPEADLVERHLSVHRRHPEREAAAVGFVDWHPEVARNRVNRWLEWSGTQSWYESLAPEGEQEVSYWYFYTSNISLKRDLLLEGGGFDEDFPFAAFEDLECGLMLSRSGLRLYYEPAAICHHLHDYDWPGLERRFTCMAVSERLMVDKHPEIEPGCLNRMKASAQGRPLPLERVVDLVPRKWERLARRVRRQADRRYNRRLATTYLDAWDRATELCELRRFLGESYDSARLVYGSGRPHEGTGDVPEVDSERPDDERIFEQARLALMGRMDRALSLLQGRLRPASTVLDYGCGTGSIGLRLAHAGYSVSFADHPGMALDYLRWRLTNRGLDLPVYELGVDELPDDFDAALCFDGIGAGRGPVELLSELEQIAPLVALGFSADGPEPPPEELVTAQRGLSSLAARHDLPGGSLLVYERRRPGHIPVAGGR